MNLNTIFIGVPLVLLALAAVVAAITFAVKAIKGRSSTRSTREKSKSKSQSTFKLFKALRAENAELTKALWIRSQDSSYKPTDKLPKGTYKIDGLMKNDKGEWLLALIRGENSHLVKLAESIKFTSKSKDEDDDDDEDDD